MEQLQQVLKHRAHTAMELLHKGILQTEAKLEQCLQTMQVIQEQVQQEQHARACKIQDQYNAKLQELTEAFENQVLILQQSTQAELADVQTETEAALQQAAASLLQELQLEHDTLAAAQLQLQPSSGVTADGPSTWGLADATASLPMDAELTMASLHHAHCSSASQQQPQRQTSRELVHQLPNTSETSVCVDASSPAEKQFQDASKDANSHNAVMSSTRSADSAGSAPYAKKQFAPEDSPARHEQSATHWHAVMAGTDAAAVKDSCCVSDVGGSSTLMQQPALSFLQKQQHQQGAPGQQLPSLVGQHEGAKASTWLLTQPVQHHKPQGIWLQTGGESCHGQAPHKGHSGIGSSSCCCMSNPYNSVLPVDDSTAPSTDIQQECYQSPDDVGTTPVQQQCSKSSACHDGNDSGQIVSIPTSAQQPHAQGTCNHVTVSARQYQLRDQVPSPATGGSSCALPDLISNSRICLQGDTTAGDIQRLGCSSSFTKPMLQVPPSFAARHQLGADMKNDDTVLVNAVTGRQWGEQQFQQASRQLSAHSSLHMRQQSWQQASRSLRKCVSSTERGSVAVLKQASSLRHQLEASWQHGLAAAAGKANDTSVDELSPNIWCVGRLRSGSPRRSSLAAGELSSDDDEAQADQPGQQLQPQSRAIKWFSISHRSSVAQRVDSGNVKPGRYKAVAGREIVVTAAVDAMSHSRQGSMRVLSRHESARKCSTAALDLLD